MTVQLDKSPDIPDAAIRAAAAAWGMRMLSGVAALYGIVQGLTIIIGGDRRFNGPGHQAALVLPGSPGSIGVTILLAGIAVLIGLRIKNDLVAEIGMLSMSAWSLAFATSFLFSALRNPDASTTGFNTYFFVAILMAVPAAVSHSSHPKRKHKHV